MTTILSITIAIALFVIGWALHIIGKPEKLILPEPETIVTQDDGYLTQHFINQRWRLQAEIRVCTDLAVLSDLWYEIERLEWDFRDAIPDQILIVHIDELFAYHAAKAGQLKSVLVP
jgi:hypothetical protein